MHVDPSAARSTYRVKWDFGPVVRWRASQDMVGNPFSNADSHMVAVFGLVHAGRSVRRHRPRLRRAALGLAAGLVATSLAACSGSAPAGAPGAGGAPGGGAPAMPVEIVTLAPKPVEQTSEFVGTIKSRQSTTIQPQVEGIHHAHPREVRRPREPGRGALRDRRRVRSRPPWPSLESHPRGARSRRDVRASSRRIAPRRCSTSAPASQQEYDQAVDAAEGGRGAAQGRRGADPPAAGRARRTTA